MKLKDAVLLYRANNRLSQKEFAAKCGVTPQTIYNIETVGQNPSKTTKVRIKVVLGNDYDIEDDDE